MLLGVQIYINYFTLYRTITFFGLASQLHSVYIIYISIYRVLSHLSPLPHNSNVLQLLHYYGLGSFPFARRYSENRFYFLFLLLLRCFSSQAYLLHAYSPNIQVSPFGYLGISDYVQLPQAFRSLSRPSSAFTT